MSYLVQLCSQFIHSLPQPSLVLSRHGILQPHRALLQDDLTLDGKVDFNNILKPWTKEIQEKAIKKNNIFATHYELITLQYSKNLMLDYHQQGSESHWIKNGILNKSTYPYLYTTE